VPKGFRPGRRTVRVVEKKNIPAKRKPSPKLSMVKVQRAGVPDKNPPSLFAFTMIVIYKNLYILGATILRRMRRYSKKTRLVLSRMRGAAYAGLYYLSQALRELVRSGFKRLWAPLVRIRSVYREQKPVMRAKRQKGLFPWASYLAVMESVMRLFGRIIATVVNHVLPVAALFILGFAIYGFVNQDFGLRVVYQDEVIGYIRSEGEFDEASRNVKSRVIVGTNYTFPIDQPSFELVICEDPGETNRWILTYNSLLKRAGIEMVELEQFTAPSDLANSIVLLSGQEVEEAYGFYLDNQFYGALEDKKGILNLLETMRRRGVTGKQGERIEFEKKIELTAKQLYLTSSIMDEKDLFAYLERNEEEEQSYIVQEGDTPTGIADKLGVSYGRLRELNPDSDIETRLMPGDEIKTRVARPFMIVKTIFTDVYEEEVSYETELIENSLYAIGFRQTEQAGVPGVREVTADITMINGIEYGREELSFRMVTPPVPERVTIGAMPVPTPAVVTPGGGQTVQQPARPPGGVSSTGFIWPVANNGGRFWGGLGSYKGHTGVDIGAPAGTPVVAAASGRVVKAKWTYVGYGIHCEIQHDSGYSTIYAHFSDMYVSVGDYVTQGQIIGAMGRTGWATGNHLHFEVKQNGAVRNPMNYISR